MPKLQLRQQLPQLATDNGSNATAQAVAGLGSALGGLGDVLKAKEARDERIAVTQIASRTKLELVQIREQFRTDAAHDGLGHAKDYQSHVEKVYADLGDSFPDKRSKEFLTNEMQSSLLSLIPSEIQFESQKRGAAVAGAEQQLFKDEVDAVKADPAQFTATMASVRARLASYEIDPATGYGMTPETVSQMASEYERDLRAAAMQGLDIEEAATLDQNLNAVQSDPFLLDTLSQQTESQIRASNVARGNPLAKKAVDARVQKATQELRAAAMSSMIRDAQDPSELVKINNMLEDKEWIGSMSASDYAASRRAVITRANGFDNASKTATTKAKAQVTKSFKDYRDGVLAGYSPESGKRPPELEDDALLATFGDDAPRMSRTLHRAEIAQPVVNAMKTVGAGDYAKVQALADKMLGDKTLEFKDKEAVIKLVKDANDERVKGLEDEPAKYVFDNSPLIQKQLAELSVLEDPEARAAAAVELRDTLVAEQMRFGVDEFAVEPLLEQELNQFKGVFQTAMTVEGETLVAAMDELKGITGQHFGNAVAQLVSKGGMPAGMTMLSNIEDPNVAALVGEGIKSRKAILKEGDIKEDDINTSAELADFFETLGTDIFPLNEISAERGEIRAATDALAMQYILQGVDNPKERAVEDIIDSRYDVAEGVRIPKGSGTNVDTFGEQLSMIITNFNAGYGEKVDWDAFEGGELKRSDVIKSVRTGNVRVVTAPDDGGVMLYSNTGAPFPMKDGTLLTIPWDEINNMEPPKGVIDSGFDKVLNFILPRDL